MEISVWNDFCVPHCYTGEVLLLKAIEQLGLKERVTLRLISFELDPTFPKGETIDVPHCVAKKYGCSLDEALEKIEAASSLGREAGIDMRFKSAVFCNMRDAHRVLKYVESRYGNEAAWKLNFAFFDAYFTKNILLEGENLVDIAVCVGIEKDDVRDVVLSDEYADAVIADEQEAYRRGIHSIPCFAIDDKYIIRGSMPIEGFKEALTQIINQ